jgi:hypothetical protein
MLYSKWLFADQPIIFALADGYRAELVALLYESAYPL